tara:strand:+ start:929 stop:1270 length:342 start_codon:yes stop_codon:yes gene_type:complete
MIIYHNNKCKKSREALNLLLNKKIDVQVIEYLKNGLTANEIKILLEKLKLTPIEIIRKKENIWKNQFKNKKLTNKEIINAIVENPILLERPIICNENEAVIARFFKSIMSITG